MSVRASTRQEATAVENRGRHTEATKGGEPELAAGTRVRYAYVKRCLDVLLALGLVIVAIPLLLLISLMILLDSGRPVFYRQERVGACGRRHRGRIHWLEVHFRILKFRTMVPDADSSPVHEHFIESFVGGALASEEHREAGFKLRDDPRVTRVGRWLRATSLDELPQLFNVLAGTMSLVGPRPVPPYEVALYEPRHRERLAALPGITGPWQVDGRARVSFEEMVKLDIEYVRRQSLWLDLCLLLRTLPAVVSKKGAG
jgi:lipopolysaccharide/colanic/teichoic acid biosynthesis glycosyltransferase